ncbi:MAG: hypothetical protein KDA21_06710 [Phycisphaerales bacterium]|nr:hypothetical protein [Phycisphaerales bacterium]
MAGYSGTPLVRKLGIREDHRVAIIDAPPGFTDLLGGLPEGVDCRTSLRSRGDFDVMILFAPAHRALTRRFPALVPRLADSGGLWVAWPKKSSGVKSDLSEDIVRDVALAAGLVDNKVCAIDDTYSGLRLVIRVSDRGTRRVR